MNDGYVHWAGESVRNAPTTDDKSKVTCPECLRMIEVLEELRKHDND